MGLIARINPNPSAEGHTMTERKLKTVLVVTGSESFPIAQRADSDRNASTEVLDFMAHRDDPPA